jgi:hypothetical protein
MFDEIDTERDVVYIFEDILLAKILREAIVESPHNRATIAPAIAQENASNQGSPHETDYKAR